MMLETQKLIARKDELQQELTRLNRKRDQEIVQHYKTPVID